MQATGEEGRQYPVGQGTAESVFHSKTLVGRSTMPKRRMKQQYVNLPPLPRHPNWCA
jgi:hypothetical protein